MSTPRPTPESDASARGGAYFKDHKLYPETNGKQLVHIDDARRLERERDEAREALSGRAVSCSQCNKAAAEIQVMREAVALMNARCTEQSLDHIAATNRTVQDNQKLRVENDAMREAIKDAHEVIKYASSLLVGTSYVKAQKVAANLQPFLP